MRKPQQLIRDGWSLSCPFCNNSVKYTYFVNWFIPTPFFYSDGCNDVLLKKSDGEQVQKLLERKKPILSELECLWKEFLKSAPAAPNGGQFSFWANVKCPFCNKEFPYNNGIRDLNVRINDSKIVLIDGAVVVGDNPEETWQVKVKINSE